MAEAVLAKYDDSIFEAQKDRISLEVNGKYCSVVEWVEERLPLEEKRIREVIRDGGPFLPEAVCKAVPQEASSGGKLNVLAFTDESGLVEAALGCLRREKKVGTMKKVGLWGKFETMDSYEKMEAVLKPSTAWDVLVFGSGIDPAASNDPDDVAAWSGQMVKTMMLIFQVLQRNPAWCPRLCIVTSGTHANDGETHAEAGLSICCAAPLFGMANTLRLEVATTAVHYVDLEYTVTDAAIETLAAEISRKTGFGSSSVRLAKESRFVARMTPAEPRYVSTSKFVTPPSGTIAIGGGNGALGLVMGKYFLEHLADPETADVALLFLSRSCKISGQGNQELWSEVQQLAARSPKVTVEQAACDVSNREAVERFVATHAATLAGFVHSAGVLRDGLLANQTFDKYDDVYKPKAWAGLYLHHALEQQACPNLQFVWMFSSVAVYGNMGQSNYSGANSFLDTLCRHRRALGKPATAMQWAGWGEVGMAASMDALAKRRMADSHIPLFTNAQGLRGMELGLSTGLPVFCVMRYNANAFFNKNHKSLSKETTTAAERYDARFWALSVPPQHYTELELYKAVASAYSTKPARELTYDYFVAADDLKQPAAIVV